MNHCLSLIPEKKRNRHMQLSEKRSSNNGTTPFKKWVFHSSRGPKKASRIIVLAKWLEMSATTNIFGSLQEVNSTLS